MHGFVGIAWRVVVLLFVLIVLALFTSQAYLDYVGENPSPMAFSEAQNRAVQDAQQSGAADICGFPMPESIEPPDGVAGTGTTYFFIMAGGEAEFAACLHDEGYLSASDLAAVEKWADELPVSWWVKVLWLLGVAAVMVVFASVLFLGRLPWARR